MALHKAPTAVTLAPTHEKSSFALWVERYWKAGSLVVVVIAGWIVARQFSSQNDREAQESAWERLVQASSEDPSTGLLTGPVEGLRTIHA